MTEMGPRDYEQYFHLTSSLKHLEAAGLRHLTADVRAKLAQLEAKAENQKRKAQRSYLAPTLSQDDIEEMAAFGVRFGAIYWVPAVMNLVEHDLTLSREFEALAESRSTTRKTRRFARALKSRSDAYELSEAGWNGFVVKIEIAHAEEDYRFTPHWSDVLLMTVYVDRMNQAIRLARVLRDRYLLRRGPVPARHLWTQYAIHRKHWSLPDFD